jgi:hypothetical protein
MISNSLLRDKESEMMRIGGLGRVGGGWLLLAALIVTAYATPSAKAQAKPNVGQGVSAQDILKYADLVRFPPEGFEVSIHIRSSQQASLKEERVLKVLSKGNENTVVMTVAPASERGQILLMKGRDLWFFLPKVSQPVRLSLAQRISPDKISLHGSQTLFGLSARCLCLRSVFMSRY